MAFDVTMLTFWMTLMNKFTSTIMDDGCVHPLAKTLPFVVNNLSWIIEIWMKNHLTSDVDCDIVNL